MKHAVGVTLTVYIGVYSHTQHAVYYPATRGSYQVINDRQWVC